jgi:uncharacterized protein YhjY with autotransporter beta-barrel domain/phospholipase/lecithinase/hemolysin
MKLKLTLLASASLASVISFGAQAQGTIYGFGDSLLDVSRNCPIAFPQSAPYGACGNGKGALQLLPQFTNYSFNPANDYAYNGVGNGVVPAFNGGPTVAQQITAFTTAGGTFQESDLVVIGGMPNNAGAIFLGIPDSNGNPYTPQTLATATMSQQYNNISALIKAGARNIVAENMFSSATYNFYVIGGFFPFGPPYQFPNIPGATTFFGLVNDNLAKTLAPLAAPGTRIHMIDLAAIYTRAYLTPSVYGFTTGTPCIFDAGCLQASKAVQNQHFMYDLHPTEAGYAVIARYEANLLGAQDGLAAQADLAQIGATTFSNAFFNRLDAYRTLEFGTAGMPAAALGYAPMGEKGPKGFGGAPAPAENPFSVYLAGTYGTGNRGDIFSDSGNSTGFKYDLAGGTVGGEYKMNPNVRIGLAFNYMNPTANLYRGSGHIKLDSYQLGGYASFTYPNWFTDVVVTYSRNAYNIDRPGVIDTIRGKTEGDALTAGFKSAYLFDLGALRIGPLVGLDYFNTTVNPYTETGDPIITQYVYTQKLESLTGSAGVQFRFPFMVGTAMVNPFINLTAEHDFLGSRRTLLSAETAAMALPIYTVIPNLSRDRTYGKVAAGLSANLGGNISGLISCAATFGNGASTGFAITGGLKLSFSTY